MAGEQKRKEDRQALITKALLLGWSIESNKSGSGGLYVLRTPEGNLHGSEQVVYGIANPPTFPTMWRAAMHALIHSGVYPPNETQPPRDTGVGSSKAFRLRGRRRNRERVPGEFKVSRTGRKRT